jgi:glycosyltransferase involved in cell wall biosynthesis
MLWERIEEFILKNQNYLDVIHVEHLRGSSYGIAAKRLINSLGLDIPIVWDSVDCISLLFKLAAHSSKSLFGRWITRFELPKTRKHEGFLIEQFDTCLVTSQIDKDALLNLTSVSNKEMTEKNSIHVLPNGVDLEYFHNSWRPGASDIILFSGKLSYHANVTASLYLIEEIMPAVWKKKPDVLVNIVGKDPPESIRRHASKNKNVNVTGWVKDLRPYFLESSISIAPMPYSVGIQNKVLEAMSSGIPVIAGTNATSALSVEPENDLLTADSVDSFSKQCIRLLEDKQLQNKLSVNGRRYVEAEHDWMKITDKLEMLYRNKM